MSERYAKLFALSDDLYCAGAPVVVVAGAIQKDNQTGKVFAQLKLRNIQDKVIKALTVQLTPFDTAGKPLGEGVSHQYLDLSAGRDTDFGQKMPVFLPDAATRSFSAAVAEVIFADNSVWTASGGPWEPLSPPQTPEGVFEDGELAKQFRLKYGGDCRCMFHREKDLWRCVCGALNHEGEAQCHRCRREGAALAAPDVSQLEKERDKRLAEEHEKAAAEKAAAELRAKKAKKIAIIAAPIVVVAIIAAVLISNWTKAQQEEAARLEAYNAAVALAEAGQYGEAIDAFTELGDYRDSAERLTETAYAQAVSLLDAKDYDDAIDAFTELGDYQDSAALLAEAEAGLQAHEAKVLLPSMVKAFGSEDKGGDESLEYFTENKERYAQLDEQEITETMVNRWVVKDKLNSPELYYQVSLYKDGTGAFSTEMDGSTPQWSASGTEFQFRSTGHQILGRTFELRKVDDDLYMAYGNVGLGAPAILFAAVSSDWGKQIKEDSREILSISYS